MFPVEAPFVKTLAALLLLWGLPALNAQQEQKATLDFSCSTFPANLSESDLLSRYGQRNIITAMVTGADDPPFEGTVLFPNQDDARDLVDLAAAGVERRVGRGTAPGDARHDGRAGGRRERGDLVQRGFAARPDREPDDDGALHAIRAHVPALGGRGGAGRLLEPAGVGGALQVSCSAAWL